MSNYKDLEFDFKITTWERVTVPEEYQEEVLEQLKLGKIDSSQEIFDYVYDNYGDCNVRLEEVENAQEQMTVGENGGQFTILVLDNGEDVWDNGDEDLERDFHGIKDILNSYNDPSDEVQTITSDDWYKIKRLLGA